MYTAYLNKHIARLTNKLIGFAFPKPVDTITAEMSNSMDFHGLRNVEVRLNDRIVSAGLTYCAWSGDKPYVVSGYNVDGKVFAESFATQDEAEQEYIVRATYVQACMVQASHELTASLRDLAGKLHLLEDQDAWVPEAPTLPPPVTASTIVLGKHA